MRASKMAAESEVEKVSKHLSLLRHEYVKLQNKLLDMEKKFSIAQAASGDLAQDSFVSRLIKLVADLYERDSFSDIVVKYSGYKFKSHRIVLAARSSHWTSYDLNELNEIELEDVSVEVGNTLMKWIYTDKADIKNDEAFIMDLVKVANRYKLDPLKERCERMLMSSVNISNCIKFYQTAEDIGAASLMKYCAEIVSSHWADLKTEDFLGMKAPLLYEMFKSKSSYPLHLAIRHHREDVVFLFLIEFNNEMPRKLNERDPQTGELPLQIALSVKHDSIAKTLVNHQCDIEAVNSDGQTLLHRAIIKGDEFGATFLIENGANVKAVISETVQLPLHLAASHSFKDADICASMGRIARLLLDNGADPNTQDKEGRTPLHLALASDNDVVFTILLSHPHINLDLRDGDGNVPLWFAIMSSEGQLDGDAASSSYPGRLVKAGSSADAVNLITGDSLLHLSAFSGNEPAGLFLISNGARPDHANKKGETPLHAASKMGLASLVTELLRSGANPNSQTHPTEDLRALQIERQKARTVKREENRHRLTMLAKSKAMKIAKERKELAEKEAAAQASHEKASKPQITMDTSHDRAKQSGNANNGDLLGNNPFAADEKNPFLDDENSDDFFDEIEAATSAAMALSGVTYDNNQAPVRTFGTPSGTHQNTKTAVNRLDMSTVVSSELMTDVKDGDIEISELDLDDGLDDDNVIVDCWDRTPVHVAVALKHEHVIKCFVDFKDGSSFGGGGGRLLIQPDFNLKDSEEQTPLEIALWTNQLNVATMIIDAEADVNSAESKTGVTLLHKAIRRRSEPACLFLLESGADINRRYTDNSSPLQMSIHIQLNEVVDALCKRGADLNVIDSKGNTALWSSLKSKQYQIAETLVRNGSDTTSWSRGINGCVWSLLHRAIFERNAAAATFLIKHKTDVNSPRRPGPEGEGGVEAWDRLTPLHLACAAGQDEVVQCLLEHHAQINSQDAEGRMPVHIAITQRNSVVTRLLLSHPELDLTLKDRLGQTPFAVAMACRNNDSAAVILSREPSSAEQFDNKGRNYLHVAIQKSDVESVLFLISIEVDVNSHIQDSSHRTPLHLAVPNGNEVIVRHLILAGADVNAQDKSRQTPLHLAAIEDKPALASVLISSNADVDLVDSALCNALHLSCQHGNMGVVKALLTESSIDAETYNARGQNPLHSLAHYHPENGAAIFELFKQTMPNYPYDSPDVDENTALFIAYVNGAVGLCCALLKAGARLGTMNKHGLSVFNASVASKKLLFKLLDLLNAEPTWSDGPICHECGSKFNVTTRKHHCRHCGRVVCNKCSSKQIPILKYELTKPVRVCEVCFDFLTVGTQ